MPDAPPLLPCPFCGGDPVAAAVNRCGETVHVVACRSCAAEGGRQKTPAAAARLWNARPRATGRTADAPDRGSATQQQG